MNRILDKFFTNRPDVTQYDVVASRIKTKHKAVYVYQYFGEGSSCVKYKIAEKSNGYLHVFGLENSVALFVMLHLETGSKKFKIAAIHQRIYHACNLEKGI
jgi:hypothetical protein